MDNVYKLVSDLCKDAGISLSKLCIKIGSSKSLMTELKAGRTKQLSIQTAASIADFFKIPVDFLLQRPPFDNWELIEKDRRRFIKDSGINPELVRFCDVDLFAPYSQPTTSFINFVSASIASAQPTKDGGWDIVLKDAYVRQKEKPTPVSESGLDTRTIELLDLVKTLSLENQAKLVELARLYVEDQRRRKEGN